VVADRVAVMGVLALLADVLFVGHSLFGPDLPPLTGLALEKLNEPARVEYQIINGAPLSWNWEHGAEAEGVDARSVLAEGGVGALVLTEAVPLVAHVAAGGAGDRLADYAALAHAGNPEVRVFLTETWASLKSAPGTEIVGDPGSGTLWRERITEDLPLWEEIAARASAESGVPVTLIPAGQAMGMLADAIAAGKVPGLKRIQDVFEDDIHPNGKGLYFLAMVHAAAISGKTPVGLPAKLTRSWQNREAVVTDGMARSLQRIAWAAVQARAPAGVAPAAAEVTPEPAAPVDEAPASPDLPALTPITNPALTFGLSGVVDWSVQLPFLDLMKTARPWIGHLPDQWGGWDHDQLAAGGYLDAEGWIKAIPPEVTGISTLVLTDLPEDAAGVAGRYVLRYEGVGTLRVEGRVAGVTETPGRIEFDHTPGEGTVLITLSQTDPENPLRKITIARADRLAALDAGQLFNPDFLARLRGVKGLRFMDWMMTNGSLLSHAEDRPLPDDYTWARKGVPLEVILALANELKADPWLNIPHLADDGLVRTYAEITRETLDPGLLATVEFSNEVWNWYFPQAQWAEAQARARWGAEQKWVQFYALRAGEVADIWAEVFANDRDRLRRVISSQTGWIGLEADILTAPLVMAEGLPAPQEHFDAYAVSAYFSGGLGNEEKAATVKDWLKQSYEAAAGEAAQLGPTGAEAEAHLATHRYDLAFDRAAAELRDGSVTGEAGDSLNRLLTEVLPHHAAVAAEAGLDLVMYEGGTHVVGNGALVDDEELTAFFTALNYAPQMGALYGELLEGWSRLSDAPFNAFVDMARPSKWGSWGTLRHLGDDNPRWQALAQGCKGC
jgi:hypothetical protein